MFVLEMTVITRKKELHDLRGMPDYSIKFARDRLSLEAENDFMRDNEEEAPSGVPFLFYTKDDMGDANGPFRALSKRINGEGRPEFYISAEGEMKNNILCDVYREQHEDGTKIEVSLNDKGQLNGQLKQRNADGSTITMHYKDGVPHGAYLRTHANGQKAEEQNFENGKLNGPRKCWYESGQLQLEEQRVNNHPHGLVTTWREDGTVKSKKNYDMGRPLDEETYHPDGNLKTRCEYEPGQFRLSWKDHFKDGRRVMREDFGFEGGHVSTTYDEIGDLAGISFRDNNHAKIKRKETAGLVWRQFQIELLEVVGRRHDVPEPDKQAGFTQNKVNYITANLPRRPVRKAAEVPTPAASAA